MKTHVLDWKQYANLARQTVAEGCVLLKNDKNALPIQTGEKVALFGRSQLNYYKSGTGSGGLVNTNYVVGILEGFLEREDLFLNETLKRTYQEWVEEHPFEAGSGWGKEPWSQEEMILSRDFVEQLASESDVAVIVIGRTAGEDQDTKLVPGGYYLTALEEEMIELVSGVFERTVVVLNVGNIIDMNWVKKYNPSAVLYAWQGGCEGGNGVVDVLTGIVTPCGKLSDTIARDIKDYPSTVNFGDEFENVYEEDIYVGYRYFETFAKEKVLYPFGFGLSYTTFTSTLSSFEVGKQEIVVKVMVTNEGAFSGKEVLQLYASAPQGALGKPEKVLIGFVKTNELQPKETQEVVITASKRSFSSYDDSGVTGHLSCFVLEEGNYTFYLGSSIREGYEVGVLNLDKTEVLEQLHPVMTPKEHLKRRKNVKGQWLEEEIPRTVFDLKERMVSKRKRYKDYTGDLGIKLGDVKEQKATMEEFLAQLSEEDLICMTRGEGMCSVKVTPGTAGAFGGVTKSLQEFGIPLACCADGPSGIRMDCGTKAFSLPNGTAMACTFNTELMEALYEYEALELRKHKIDLLLGPGINLHRNPLNGRNFEYFSEDPLLTGKMAAAQLRGMHAYGVSGTIKHFAANNQEFSRIYANAAVSERALRELYLYGFELAVKEGNACSIMTMYGPINGIWAASNYDLLTTVLREEWGFYGSVMTDWWAMMNEEGEEAKRTNTDVMIRAQNDLYMVVNDAQTNSMNDNTLEGLKNGVITRDNLMRCAENICNTLMRLPVMERFYHPEEVAKIEELHPFQEEEEDYSTLEYQEVYTNTSLDVSKINATRGRTEVLGLIFKDSRKYLVEVKVRAKATELAQLPITIYLEHQVFGVTLTGDDKDWVTISHEVGPFFFPNQYMKLYFGQTGLEVGSIVFKVMEE